MRRIIASSAAALLAAAGLAGGARAEEPFDLQALVAAAEAEPPINVYSSTGKIVEQAEAFAKKYGVEATGTKANAAAQLEMVIREGQAKNVQGDVIQISDVAAGVAQLLPEGFATSWVPPDLADKIDPRYRDPLVVSNEANLWAYNTQAYDKCPIENIWQLTEPEWKGKVALQDPLGKASYIDWFNQMAVHGDEAVAAAYEARYGKPLETDEASATAAWVAALAANAPLLTDADEAAAQAVGAPDQKDPFVGMMSSAKFRNNTEAGAKLGICAGMQPWAGWLYPSLGLIADRHRQPERRQALHPLPPDRGGHRPAGRRRQDVDQRRRQAAGRRALGHRRGHRPDVPLRPGERRRRLGRPAGLAGPLARQLREVTGTPSMGG